MDANGLISNGPDGAPVIVFIHGWGASKDIWLSVLNSRLSQTYRLVAIDLPGVGDRKSEETDGFPQSLADSVATRLNDAGFTEYSLVGHSQGANVGAWLAHTYPERVKSLVIVCGALVSHKLPSAHHYLSPTYGKPLLDSLRHLAGLAGRIESALPQSNEPTLGWTRGYMRRSGYLYDHNHTPELIKQLRGLVSNPFDLTHISPTLPVTWIHGAKDSTIPVDHARNSISERPTNSTLLIYDDALHCPMDTHMERFIDDVAKAVG